MRITPITVWVASNNESNCRLENKMVSTFIWRKVRQYCTLFSQTFYGLLLSYLTITDVTSYVHHKFPVLSCCTAQPNHYCKQLNVPITKNNSWTFCVPMFVIRRKSFSQHIQQLLHDYNQSHIQQARME